MILYLHKNQFNRIGLFFILLFCFFNSAKADLYYVTTVSDTGAGSLRAAIDSSNTRVGLDSIILQLTVHDTIYLGSGLPTISDSLFISGLACQNPTISGELVKFNNSAFHATTASPLTINYLNIINCTDTVASATGAAVKARLLFVQHCYFAGNLAKPFNGSGRGGAIYSVNLFLYNSTFNANRASNKTNSNGLGGAVYSSGVAGFYNCTFNGNNSAGPGGAVFTDSAVFTNCTFTNNSAGTSGGAISGTDSTFIGNCIVWNNTAASAQGLYFIRPVTSGGCNVLQPSSNNFNLHVSGSDIEGTDPMLDTLGYFNGCVPVIPIFCGSVAQDHASCSRATATDEQGIPAIGVRDAGAFEITPLYLGADTIDSIQPGTTADLVALFNTTGLTYFFKGNFTDSTQVDTGTYTIIAVNFLGCTDTAIATIRYARLDTMVDTLTAINNIKAATGGIFLYPNPGRGEVHINLSGGYSGSAQICVTDLTGRKLIMQQINMVSGFAGFDITCLSTGLYELNVLTTTGERYYTKLQVVTRY